MTRYLLVVNFEIPEQHYLATQAARLNVETTCEA
jgi:hypothetical protein